MKNELRTLILAVALAGLIAGCSIIPPTIRTTRVGNGTGDMSLRTFQPCAPPCWYNVIPGRSTAADVRRILPTLPFLIAQSIEEVPYTEEHLTYFRWRYTDPQDEYGSIWLRDDRVISIEARPGFRLELREVIDRFGSPDRIHPVRALFPDARGYYSVGVYYLEKGVTFGTIELPELSPDASDYPVEPNFVIGVVHYLEPAELDQLLTRMRPLSITSEYAQIFIQQMYPWQGFGTFPFRPTPTP